MSTLLETHPMVTQEHWESFTQTEHTTWGKLFEKQSKLLKEGACHEVLEGIHKLGMCHTHIPKFCDLNALLKKETGFSIVPVTGLIPEDLFFHFLAQRKFPSTCFIRKPSQLDYLEEPDIFHDVFGHIPLLIHPVFADFMEEFGKKGLQAIKLGKLEWAARLYWFTVEFGLIKTKEGLRIYGAGITSSYGESIYCLESRVPLRLKFDLQTLIKTPYHTDSFQNKYFVIESFEELFEAVHTLDWKEFKGEKR